MHFWRFGRRFRFSWNGSQAPGPVGIRCRRYDPLGMADGDVPQMDLTRTSLATAIDAIRRQVPPQTRRATKKEFLSQFRARRR